MIDYQFIKPTVIRANMLNNDDMVKTFVSMYLEQCNEDFGHLSKAVAEKNYEEISAKAHYIKPTIEYIGATEVREQFQHLEDITNNKQDFSEITHSFAQLQANFNSLMEELKAFRSSLG